MKKLLLLTLSVSFIFSLNAQEINSNQVFNKKGIAILPEKGNFGIGIDAVPFIDYVGNLTKITDDPNSSPDFAFTAQRPGQLYGKYYFKDNKAVRMGLRLGISSHTDKDGNPFDPDEIDELKENSLNIGIAIGVENYRNFAGRLRGFWGFEIGVGKTPYYGSDYSGVNTVTGKVEFTDGASGMNNFSEEGGNTIDFYGKGIVGVEYYIAPKISLAGEFGIGLGYETTSERKYKPENGDTEVYDAGSSELSVENTASGAIVLLFHF